MKKKEYRMPSVKVVMIENSAILCGSPTIGRGNGNEKPAQGGDGYIHVDSKRGFFDDAWDE